MKISDLFEDASKSKFFKDITEPFKNNIQTLLNSSGETSLFRGVDLPPSRIGKASPTMQWAVVPARSASATHKNYKPRESLTGDNSILNLTTALDSWKDLPNRKLSSIATPDFQTAEEFGKAYLIIPADDVTRFAEINTDFNYAKIGNIKLLDVAAYTDRFATAYSDMTDETVDFNNTQSIIKLSDWCDRNLKVSSGTLTNIQHKFQYFLNDSRCKSLKEAMIDKMSPKSLKIKTYNSYSALLENVPGGKDHEIWFQGAYLALRHTAVESSNHFRITVSTMAELQTLLN